MSSLVISFVILLIIVSIVVTGSRSRKNRDRELAVKLRAISIDDRALQSVVRGLSEGGGAAIRAVKEYRDITGCDLYEAKCATNLLRAQLKQS